MFFNSLTPQRNFLQSWPHLGYQVPQTGQNPGYGGISPSPLLGQLGGGIPFEGNMGGNPKLPGYNPFPSPYTPAYGPISQNPKGYSGYGGIPNRIPSYQPMPSYPKGSQPGGMGTRQRY